MELLAGNCRKRPADDFGEDVDPFGSSEWMYGSRSLRPQGNDDEALATLADLAPPPQKLKPIRCVVKPASEDRHPLDILAGSLDRLPPEMGFLGGDGCFEAPLGTKIADVEESGQLTRGFAKDEAEMEGQGRVSRHDGVSLSSSSVDSDRDSSKGGFKGKRKRKTREKKIEHFVEKLVESMMKRQEKMHNQLIMVMEKMEHERIRSEEAWRQQETERMKQNEEARMQEMSRSSSIISFIKSVIGEEDIEIPNLTNPLPKGCESAHQRQGDVKFVFPSGRRWPHEEVQALIDSRSQVEEKTGMYKVAIWDDVSAKMKERGYERSAKKCKEKWENMNKYYRRVVEGKKTQPEHSKTRSYFEKLGNFYKTNSVEKEE